MVNQNPLLFNTSIGENIAYGAPDREVSEKGEFSNPYQAATKPLPEIIKAAKLANAHDFITSFRGGYDTLAGSLGTQVDWTFFSWIRSLSYRCVLSGTLASCPVVKDKGSPSLERQSVIQESSSWTKQLPPSMPRTKRWKIFKDILNQIQVVSEALERIMEGRTILVIAHRLSTVRNAHEILVMQGGQVVERGKHNELIEMDGVYKRLVRQQMEEGGGRN